MVQAQVIGGGTNGTKRSKMLPPTGEGPVEVTREALGGESEEKPQETGLLAEQERTAQATAGQKSEAEKAAETATAETAAQGGDPSARLRNLLPAEVATALVTELPDETSDPGSIITACEDRLRAATMLHEQLAKRILDSYFYYAGPAVRLAHKTESWRSAIDPSTGRKCRSWSAWLRMMKVSRQHAVRMAKEVPLMKALSGLDVKQLNTAQIDALSPVLNNSGSGEVRRLWTHAVGWGDTSGPSLLKLRAQLGLEPHQLISEGEEESSDSDSDLPVLRFQTRAGTFDAGMVRKVARSQPEIALLVARAIFDELGEEASAEG